MSPSREAASATVVEAASQRALRRPALGHPRHPVLVGAEGFHISGPVGSIVHIRFTVPFPVPDYYGRDGRAVLTGGGDWHGIALGPESDDAMNTKQSLTAVTAGRSLVCHGPCPEDVTATLVFSYARSLPVGDYVLALTGPPGTTTTALLRGADPTVAPTRITQAYPMPYVSGVAHDPKGTSTPHKDGRGALVRAALGRRTLGTVVVGVHEYARGVDVSVALCIGGSLPPSNEQQVIGAYQQSCAGGGAQEHTGVSGRLTASATGFAALTGGTDTGAFEINGGGGWAATCLDAACTFDGRVFAVALDS